MEKAGRPSLIQAMEPYVIKRGNRWVKLAFIPFMLTAAVLLYYDRHAIAGIVLSAAPVTFAFEPRSWIVREDGSITYKDRKTLLVFRPAPLIILSQRNGFFHLKFKTGRVLDLPIAGLRQNEKNVMYALMEKSLIP